ncbi:MAG: hypothetical protein RML94_01975 [Bacteroidia bacterium]|nr:hypothetical protein [Bacteroidia bacterium]
MLCSCGQGRRATGCASLRCFANATHCLTHPSHASRKNLGRSAGAIYSKFYPVSTSK